MIAINWLLDLQYSHAQRAPRARSIDNLQPTD